MPDFIRRICAGGRESITIIGDDGAALMELDITCDDRRKRVTVRGRLAAGLSAVGAHAAPEPEETPVDIRRLTRAE